MAPVPVRPEVLAPAGDAEAMRAAIAAGADAVYFGLHGTSARARATNFDAAPAALAGTMRLLHGHGVKGYVALNTLVFDHELDRLEQQVRACATAGVDAVIVQDLGVARLVRAVAPSLSIHASTQMTCTDAASVALARDIGARRVVLARELSLEDIAAIRAEVDVDLEVFVHGALCIAYSGQCLTSEAIGGRSANRGACAQACRLPYELVVDGVERDLGDVAHLLSPEDLEASALVPELARLGVASLKIEGRLKGPEYVAATTRLYRRAVDALGGGPAPTDEDRATALQMFTRGSGPGFLRGVDHQRLVEGRTCDHRGLAAGTSLGTRRVAGKRCVALTTSAPVARGDGLLVEAGRGEAEIGGRVWAIFAGDAEVDRAEPGQEVAVWLGPERRVDAVPSGARVWKTSDPARDKQALAVLRDPHRLQVDMRVTGAIGSPPRFEARTARGVRAAVTGDAPVEEARTSATTPAVLREKLGKLGETPFALETLEVELPPGAMLPLSSVNRARRALTDALLAAQSEVSTPTTSASYGHLLAAASPPDRAPPPAGLFVLCRNLRQAEAALDAGADGVVLDFLELVGTGAALRALRARPTPAHVTLAAPRIRKPGEQKIDHYLAQLAPDALLVRSLGSLHDAPSDGIPRVGDSSLNVTNKLAAAEVLDRGLVSFTPSFDLDADQLAGLLASPFGPFAEVVVHHPMPLFHMEHCVIAALLSNGGDHKTCGRPCESHAVSLRDRAGTTHPVEADVGCRNTVFHGAAQSAAGLVPSLLAHGVGRYRIELVRETTAEVSMLVRAYRALVAGTNTPAEIWRQLRTLKADGGYGVVRGSLRVVT